MERESLIYKLRRQGQIFAYKIIPNDLMCKLYSWVVLKESINLLNPKTFNEKLQWLKIYHYPNNQLVVRGADKYAVRKYVDEKGLSNILVPLLGAWKSVNDIDWDVLPDQFVLKCNHGCAYNVVCSDKDTLDKLSAIKKLRKWMKEDFGAFNIEPHYSMIQPRMITAEEYLGERIIDYKFFCFNGEPKFVYISKDLINDRQAQMGFYLLDGTKIPLSRDDYASIDIDGFPDFFESMRNHAEVLCQDFKFVRVDFFLANGTYYFAELTFTPSAGMMPIRPRIYDVEWGQMLDINI